jgi:tripartite ATP-independent transporter DctP family solute receptor
MPHLLRSTPAPQLLRTPASPRRAAFRLLVGAGLAIGLIAGAAAQTVTRINVSIGKDSHQGVAIDHFAKEVTERTKGRYKIEAFYAGSLGGERESIESVQLGTQALTLTSTGPVPNFVPEARILDIPFLFRDKAHARAVLDGPIGEEIAKKFESKGLKVLSWCDNGVRHMTNSKRDVHTPDDLKGLKLRTMENPVHMAAYKALGIVPTPMAFPEVFTALQQGTVDGQENPIPVILASKFSQVQKHLSLTGHVYSPAALILSPAVWNKLSAADKAAFTAAAKKGAAAQRKKVNDDENTGIAQLKSEGMQVVEKVDGESFRKAVAPAYAQFAKEFGADKIAAIQAVK